jgi:hypothetical protein
MTRYPFTSQFTRALQSDQKSLDSVNSAISAKLATANLNQRTGHQSGDKQ